MKYFLGFPYWPEKIREYISESEYINMIDNYNFLVNVCAIEERFDILINNYYEYEKCLNSILLNSFLAFGIEVVEFQKNEREIIRLLNNLLSSCRLFLDQNLKILPQIDTNTFDNYSKKTHDLYDNNIEYRLLEYLRNVLQHREMPISIEFYKKFAQTKDERAEESINVLLNIKTLLEHDKSYNMKVKIDLLSFNKEKIILNFYVRKYIYLMGVLLQEIRKDIKDKYTYSYEFYSNLIKEHNKINTAPENEIQKIVYINKEEKGFLERTDLSDALIKNLNLLIKRNRASKDYSGFVMKV